MKCDITHRYIAHATQEMKITCFGLKLKSPMQIKLGFYVDYTQWKAYHTHLIFFPYGDHSLNTHKTFYEL